jgi:hypothetical protein
VSEFVEECRREWKRLGVPDPIAGEMAADLAADLAEAEVDGVSAEQVLGSGAFDPRAFAASWASERGVVGPSPPPSTTQPQPPPTVTTQTQPSTTPTQPSPLPGPVDRPRLRLPDAIFLAGVVVVVVAALALVSRRTGAAGAAVPVRFDPQGPSGGGFPVFVNAHHSLAVPAVGVLLLLVAIAGLVVWLRYRSPWAGVGRASGRGSRLDGGVGGPG